VDPERYAEYTSQIRAAVSADPQVVGLIALGSTAERKFRDDWSDHDFWIITKPGREEHYLDSVDWMPDSHRILLTARHGANNRTAIYWDGHKVEFAAYDLNDAQNGKLERFSVLLERGGVLEMADAVKDSSRRTRKERLLEAENISNLAIFAWTYYARMRRGEWLAAHRFLFFGVELLQDLLGVYCYPEDDARVDFLDPTRRLEQVKPELAAELKEILTRADAMSGLALLRIAEREIRPQAQELDWNPLLTVCDWMED
jgi:hypothetical protein